jgi:hypothetical protein
MQNSESLTTFTYSPLEHKIACLSKQTEVKITFQVPTLHIILQIQK